MSKRSNRLVLLDSGQKLQSTNIGLLQQL